VTATITAEKGPRGIRIQSSHLNGVVEGLEGIERMTLQEIAKAAEDGCTISIAIRGSLAISFDVAAI
jgi:organic hydroperoxide reductase OsmC/OhrA